MKTPIDFGSRLVLKVTTPAPEPEPVARPRRKIQLSTRVELDTYLGLKQASWWVPGLVEEDFVNAAIREKLARTEGAERPLPAPELERLRQKKKLGG